jgi:glycosyltransferase involved in cell wall biosynthesis
MRTSVAIALYADLTHDGRVQREATTLARAGYDVTIAALRSDTAVERNLGEHVRVIASQPMASQVLPGSWSPFRPEQPGADVHVPRGGRLGWFVAYGRNLRAWGRWAAHAVGHADVWHAVDLTGLIALGLAGIDRDTRLIYDSHELFVESGSIARMPRPAHWAVSQVERHLARKAAGVVTVNPAIAAELSRRYGVDPVVVMNCPPLVDVRRPGVMRDRLSLASRPVLLHHGSLSEGRGIRTTIDALRALPQDVALVLLGDGPLVPWIREQQADPELVGRLFWHPAVGLDELLSWVVDADLGVMLFEPLELNFMYATPNRLFDCILTGVPILASDFPEFRRIVKGEGFGEVCDPRDTRSIVESVRRLLDAPGVLVAIQERARAAAQSTYNWDAQAAQMLALYDSVIGSEPAAAEI